MNIASCGGVVNITDQTVAVNFRLTMPISLDHTWDGGSSANFGELEILLKSRKMKKLNMK